MGNNEINTRHVFGIIFIAVNIDVCFSENLFFFRKNNLTQEWKIIL